MTKKEMVGLLESGQELFQSEEYKKTGCVLLNGYLLGEIKDFSGFAQDVFEGEKQFDFDAFEKDMERAKGMIAKELDALEKRGGLSFQELSDKVMQGIVNGALGIRYAEIAPYSHGYEVTFGGKGPAGSTRDFKNRWECYCDFFDIGNQIAGKIESNVQNNQVSGKKCEEFHISEMLNLIEQREMKKNTSFIPEKDTDFKRQEGYNRGSIATVMDVHATKGLDGIVKHHYHGDYSSITPVRQNSLVEMMVCLNGFCLDCLQGLDVSGFEKEMIVQYLKRQGTDISTPEKLEEWISKNPEKCGLEENREKGKRFEKRDFLGLKQETYQVYMDKGLDEEELEGLVEEWGLETVEKGYAEFQADNSEVIIEKAYVIEAIGDLMRFEDDFDACRQAEKDGVKFIMDIPGLEKGCYLDTSWNRYHCEFMLEKYPEYRIENWFDPSTDYGKKYIECFGNPIQEKEGCLEEKYSLEEKIGSAKEKIKKEPVKDVKIKEHQL